MRPLLIIIMESTYHITFNYYRNFTTFYTYNKSPVCCFRSLPCYNWGRRRRSWHSWLRHCATSRKVVVSFPDDVIGNFHWHNPSGSTTALSSSQTLTEMSTRNIFSVVKAAGTYGWQPYHLYVPIVLKSGSLILLEPSGLVQACTGIDLPFTTLELRRMRGLLESYKYEITWNYEVVT